MSIILDERHTSWGVYAILNRGANPEVHGHNNPWGPPVASVKARSREEAITKGEAIGFSRQAYFPVEVVNDGRVICIEPFL